MYRLPVENGVTGYVTRVSGMDASEKKFRILEAAEQVVSEKGLSDATISEIAGAAGLADSVIYQFFKGKQDLVFSLPISHEEEFFTSLNEHLKGIWDTESRLMKILWFYLRYCDTHPQYAKILYFDCFSSVNFYRSAGYASIRRYARILLECLEDGVRQGKFSGKIDTILVRDMILGMMGCEIVQSIASKTIDATAADVEDMMSLILSILRPRPETEENKVDKILDAAEKVFADKGVYRARVLDIAKLAGVSEGTVYEYFGNKEDLLLSLPDRHFRRYQEGLPEIFEIRSPVLKLQRFIKYYFSLFFEKQDFLKVFLVQIQLTRRFYETEQFNFFVQFFDIVQSIVEEGMADGSFRPDVNPMVFRNMFIGTFNNLTLRWFIVHGDRHEDKMRKIEEVAELLCSAVTNTHAQPAMTGSTEYVLDGKGGTV